MRSYLLIKTRVSAQAQQYQGFAGHRYTITWLPRKTHAYIYKIIYKKSIKIFFLIREKKRCNECNSVTSSDKPNNIKALRGYAFLISRVTRCNP